MTEVCGDSLFYKKESRLPCGYRVVLFSGFRVPSVCMRMEVPREDDVPTDFRSLRLYADGRGGFLGGSPRIRGAVSLSAQRELTPQGHLFLALSKV